MDPYVGEIRLMSFAFAPRGWALCDGQQLPISQNQALFSLLGTIYGGNGVTTFALPNLQGRVAIHRSSQITQGAVAGSEAVTLQVSQMAAHNHVFNGTSVAAGARPPTAGLMGKPASGSNNYYAADSNPLQPLHPISITPTGGGQPHNNMQPYLVLSYCMALQGIFPSRN